MDHRSPRRQLPRTRAIAVALTTVSLLALSLGPTRADHDAPEKSPAPETVIPPDEAPAGGVAGNARVAEIVRTFGGRGVMADGSRPTPADVAAQQFRVRDGFAIDLVASEPAVTQPLFLSWDSRGRLWVVQYRQYQYPAGLQVVRFDQHLRAVFDQVPEPPPRGTPGADKITVFEDTDADGRFDTHRDVITGLSIATSVAIGHGGIWVLNPPYLLCYRDRDRDDVPDAEPEVHLSGFGLEDTHSVANSLLWGPDGWLYGANGSTTVGNVSSAATKGVRFEGQCVWRYHPESRVFELWAEGGGNTFSLDIDAEGRVFSGTNGGGTRGFYFPQGSYARKNWGKHGPLTNPYAFGFFEQMRSEGDTRRFPQAFTIYDGGLFPDELAGDILAPNAMTNLVWHSRRLRDGSTFQSVDQPNLVESPDRWFRPVYAGVGPDGALYIADWCDSRLSHVSPIDDWDKESGRVWRVRPSDSTPAWRGGDLAAQSSTALIALFTHRNKWVRQRAALELGWRGDRTVVDALVDGVSARGSLESLWALSALGELTTARAVDWLAQPSASIRRWVVRLLGDRHEGHPELAALAAREDDVDVRSQLAATAKRIPAQTALAIVRELARHTEDLDDPHLPLMTWWALEAHAGAWSEIEALFADPAFWRLPIVRRTILARLAQRYAAAGTAADLEHCARLVALAPDAEARALLLGGLERAFEGRSLPRLPAALDAALRQHQATLGSAGIVLALRRSADDETARAEALRDALRALRDENESIGLRVEIVRALGETRHKEAVPELLRIATGGATSEPALQRVAIATLAAFDDPSIAPRIVQAFGGEISKEHDLRATAFRTLATRLPWASALVTEFAEWRLLSREMPADVLERLRAYDDDALAARVLATFGPAVTISSEQKRERVAELRVMLRAAPGGDTLAGKSHYDTLCATCHALYGEGKRIGPPLDAYDRGNVDFWLVATIEPSLEIREGFESWLAITRDGRTLTGRIAAQDPATVTLVSAEDQRTQVERSEIIELRVLETSLMPEDLLVKLGDAQIRDLFAYLSQGASRSAAIGAAIGASAPATGDASRDALPR